MDMLSLSKALEEKRRLLSEHITEKGLNLCDKEILRLSRELDALITVYNQMLMEEGKAGRTQKNKP